MSFWSEHISTLRVITTVLEGVRILASLIRDAYRATAADIDDAVDDITDDLEDALDDAVDDIDDIVVGQRRIITAHVTAQRRLITNDVWNANRDIKRAMTGETRAIISGVQTHINAAERRLDTTLRAILRAVSGREVSVDVDADEVAEEVVDAIDDLDLATAADLRRTQTAITRALALQGAAPPALVRSQGQSTRDWVTSSIESVLAWLRSWKTETAPRLSRIKSDMDALELRVLTHVTTEATKTRTDLGAAIARETSAVRTAVQTAVSDVNANTVVQANRARARSAQAQRVIVEAINTQESALIDEISDTEETVTTALSSGVDQLTGTLNTARQQIVASTTQQIDRLVSAQQQSDSGIGRILDGVVRGITNGFSAFVDRIRTTINNVINVDLDDAFDFVRRLLDAERVNTQSVVDAVRAIVDRLEPEPDAVADAIDRQTVQTKATADGVDDLTDLMRSVMGGDDRISRKASIERTLSDLLSEFVPGTPPTEAEIETAERILKATGPLGENCSTTSVTAALHGGESRVTPSDFESDDETLLSVLAGNDKLLARFLTSILKTVFGEFGGYLFGLLAIAQGRSQFVQLAYLFENPCLPLSAADVIRLHRLGHIDDDAALVGLRQWGYNQNRAAALLSSDRVVPPAGVVLDAWHRDIVSDQYADDTLKQAGYDETDREMLRRQSYYRVPPSDLILMSVRDVFSPEARRRLSLDEDFPSEFLAEAKRIGISETVARNYWAAHWTLPSLGQGYEMRHRGVINDATLDDLMRAKDIAPIWRPRLKAISYRPLNRIDVRRMYGVGVLSRDDVLRSYLDLGYSPDNAENMTEYTVRYEDERAPDASEQEAEGLTRGLIIRMFERGVVSRVDARTLLIDAGNSPDVADLYLSYSELDQQLARQDADIDTALVRLREGVASELATRSYVGTLQLTDTERKLVEREIDQIVLRRVRQPTRSDLDRAARGGLLDKNEYVDTLVRLGYDPVWANRFANLTGAFT